MSGIKSRRQHNPTPIASIEGDTISHLDAGRLSRVWIPQSGSNAVSRKSEAGFTRALNLIIIHLTE